MGQKQTRLLRYDYMQLIARGIELGIKQNLLAKMFQKDPSVITRVKKKIKNMSPDKSINFTYEYAEEVVQDYQRGLAVSEIASKYNIRQGSIYTLLKERNIPLRLSLRALSDEQKQFLLEHAHRYSDVFLSKKLNIPVGKIKYFRYKNNIIKGRGFS